MKINHLYIWFVLFARRFLKKFYLGHIVIHSFRFNYYFIFCFDAVLVLSDMDQFTFLIEASNSYRSRSHCWSCFGLPHGEWHMGVTHGDTWGVTHGDTWSHGTRSCQVRWLGRFGSPSHCYRGIANIDSNQKTLKCTSIATKKNSVPKSA